MLQARQRKKIRSAEIVARRNLFHLSPQALGAMAHNKAGQKYACDGAPIICLLAPASRSYVGQRKFKLAISFWTAKALGLTFRTCRTQVASMRASHQARSWLAVTNLWRASTRRGVGHRDIERLLGTFRKRRNVQLESGIRTKAAVCRPL